MRRLVHKLFLLICLSALLASCLPTSGESGSGGIQLPSMEIPLRDFAPSQPAIQATPVPTQTFLPIPTTTQSVSQPPSTRTPTITPLPYPLWTDPSVPEALRESTLDWNLPRAENESTASLTLRLADPADENKSTWIYALVAPFPTVMDGVVLVELETAWSAPSSGPMPGSPLRMTESTFDALSTILGEAGEGAVEIVSAEELGDALWENQPAWGVVPFESLEPRLKVLTVDGQSPVRNDFDASAYPLKVDFSLTGNQAASFELPVSNRDPSKLTVLMMTGVTALVRATATRMEIVGLDYPAWDIGETLKAADITQFGQQDRCSQFVDAT